MAYNFFGAIALTGGTDGALDTIDGSLLLDGDGAIVLDATNNKIYCYTLNAGSGAAEASPTIISPDDNPGTKRWELTKVESVGLDVMSNDVWLTQVDSGGAAVNVLKVGADNVTYLNCKAGEEVDLQVGGVTIAEISSSGITLSSGATINEFSTDGTMTGNSDTAVPTEQAVVEYCDSLVGTAGVGVIATKNKLMNGGFDIWQRGTSFSPGASAVTADRWKAFFSADTITVSRQQFTLGQTSVPGNPNYFLRYATTTAGTAGSYSQLVQRIDKPHIFSSQDYVLSFWAKASAGTPDVAVDYATVFNSGASISRTYLDTITLSTSWQQFEIPFTFTDFTGETYVPLDDFMQMEWWLSAGSTYNTATNSLGTQSITMDIAQVQLEEGADATAFDYITPRDESLRCEAYYQTGIFAYQAWVPTVAQGGYTPIHFRTTMRDAPTVTVASTRIYSGSWNNTTSETVSNTTNKGAILLAYDTVGGPYTTYGAYLFDGTWTADAEL